jgi:hypothetical protein
VPVVQWIGRSPPKAEICWFDSSRARRGVAKPSIAPRSGRGDRGSRAHHPDQGIAQPSRAPALGAGGAGAKPATLTVACIEPTWYPRPMNPKREMVRWLRRKGRSYAEISKQLGVAKSSIHHMVQGIVLNAGQKRRLQGKQEANWTAFGSVGSTRKPVSARTRRSIQRAMRNWWRTLEPDQHATVLCRMRESRTRRHKSRSPSIVPRTLDRQTYRMCLRNAPTLGLHPNWNYIMARGGGYLAVQCPDHPHRTPRGYVPVHRLVLECKLGSLLSRAEVVHHRNGKVTDNTAGNLDYTTRTMHSRIHARPPTWLELHCGWCGCLFRRTKRDCRNTTKSGLRFCSRSCGVRHQQAQRKVVVRTR